jgi:hypothetical protein
MSTYRSFQLSDETFWGFRVTVDMAVVCDFVTLVSIIKCKLKAHLLMQNLVCLSEKVDSLSIVLSGFGSTPFVELVHVTRPTDTIYLCSH